MCSSAGGSGQRHRSLTEASRADARMRFRERGRRHSDAASARLTLRTAVLHDRADVPDDRRALQEGGPPFAVTTFSVRALARDADATTIAPARHGQSTRRSAAIARTDARTLARPGSAL